VKLCSVALCLSGMTKSRPSCLARPHLRQQRADRIRVHSTSRHLAVRWIAITNSNRLENTTHNMKSGGRVNLLRHRDSLIDWSEAPVLRLRYRIIGDMSRLRIAQLSSPVRQDGLWKHTCFEAFVKGPAEAYYEFNFSPSRQWAAYRFDGYRQAMAQLNLSSPPAVHVESSPGSFALEAVVDLKGLGHSDPGSQKRLGLAAVIEQRSGSLSYWALHHPPGTADFHNPDGFVLALTGHSACARGTDARAEGR